MANFKQRDWGGPVIEVIHTAYLLVLDAIQISALFAITQALEWMLERISIKPLVIFGRSLDAIEIVQNFDYALLVLFLTVLIWRLKEASA